MLNLSEVVATIHNAWKRSWFKRFLGSFTLLGRFFNTLPVGVDNLVSYDFMKTYLNSSWFSRWLFGSFVKVYEQRIGLHEAVDIFSEMKNKGCFNEQNACDVLNHPNPRLLAPVINSPLYKDNRQVNGLLTPDNKAVLAQLTDIRDLFHVLRSLTVAGLLNQANFNLMVAHPQLQQLSYAIFRLEENGVLNQKNLDILVNQRDPSLIRQEFNWLSSDTNVPQVFYDEIAGHPNPRSLGLGFKMLWMNRIADARNRHQILQFEDPINVCNMLHILSLVNMLTQAHFDEVLDPRHQALLISPILLDLNASQIKGHWGAILEASKAAHPETALLALRDQILIPRQAHPPIQRPVALNDRQSTHTASVNRSVSASASRLFARYGDQLEGKQLDKIIVKIIQWAGTQDNIIVQRCILRVAQPAYTHMDERSGVSTKQLLALSWLAMHDEGLRQGDLPDALGQFAEGLYECQRGYNLSDQGLDTGGPDDPICVSGTFNKIVEKLQGIHPDVTVDFISMKTACLKFPKIVEEAARRYLANLTKPSTAAGFLYITARLQAIEKDGDVSMIWEQIKPEVATRFFEEFGYLFKGENDPQLLELIETGVFVPLSLPSFQKQLSESEGYREHCSEVTPTSARFFSKMARTESGSVDALDKDDSQPSP